MIEDTPVAGTPLDPGLLSGKRSAPRKRRTLAVEVRGPGGRTYAARTVDISRGGMLLEFTDTSLRSSAEQGDLLAFASRIATTFPTGMSASFGEGAVRARAQMVRVVTTSGPTSTLLLGCRFDAPLELVDCRLLGVETDGNELEAAPTPAETEALSPYPVTSEEMKGLLEGRDGLLSFLEDAESPWEGDGSGGVAIAPPPIARPLRSPPLSGAPTTEQRADPTTAPLPAAVGISDDDLRLVNRNRELSPPPLGSTTSPVWAPAGTVVAHLFPTAQTGFGPRFTGCTVEVRTRGVVVEMAAPAGESDPVAWAAALGAEVRAVLLREGRVLWETRARVQRLMEAAGGVVVAVLLAEGPPPAGVRRAFLPAGVGA